MADRPSVYTIPGSFHAVEKLWGVGVLLPGSFHAVGKLWWIGLLFTLEMIFSAHIYTFKNDTLQTRKTVATELKPKMVITFGVKSFDMFCTANERHYNNKFNYWVQLVSSLFLTSSDACASPLDATKNKKNRVEISTPLTPGRVITEYIGFTWESNQLATFRKQNAKSSVLWFPENKKKA